MISWSIFQEINVNKIFEDVETDLEDADIQDLGKKLYKEYSFKKKAYNSLRSELSAFLKHIPKKPLVVLVDELDRVRPDYSVKFLEAIKHIFSIQGVCFVLAVDRDQLEASIQQLYGEIDFENYYRRFVTREAQLPEVTKLDLMPFIQIQAHEFFDEKRDVGIKFPFNQEGQQDVLKFISAVCKAFRFVPRKIETLFRIFSQLMAVVKTNLTAKPNWTNTAVILIAISIDNRSIYNQIGNASVSPEEFYKYIKELNFSTLNDSNYERYIIFLAMASCMRTEQEKELNQIVDLCLEYDEVTTSTDNIEEKRQHMVKSLAIPLDIWGRLDKRSAFQSIYGQIEEWRPFIE
jgi:KAP-like P-loop domain-containing protein